MVRQVPKRVPPPPAIVKKPVRVHKVKIVSDVPTREEFIAAYCTLKPRFTRDEAGEVYDVLCGPAETFNYALKEWGQKFAEQKLNVKKY